MVLREGSGDGLGSRLDSALSSPPPPPSILWLSLDTDPAGNLAPNLRERERRERERDDDDERGEKKKLTVVAAH